MEEKLLMSFRLIEGSIVAKKAFSGKYFRSLIPFSASNFFSIILGTLLKSMIAIKLFSKTGRVINSFSLILSMFLFNVKSPDKSCRFWLNPICDKMTNAPNKSFFIGQ